MTSVQTEKIVKFLLLIYLCASFGHNSGTGFDAIFVRGSFALLALAEFVYLGRESGFKRVPFDRIIIRYIYFFFFYFVSFIWGNVSDGAYYIGNIVQILVAVYVLCNHTHDIDDALLNLKMFLFADLYMMVRLVIATPTSAWGTERVGEALSINANVVGMMSSMGMLICMFFAEKRKFYYIAAIFSAVIALFSGSRKAFFVIIIGFAIFWLWKDRGLKAFRNVIIVIVVIGLIFYLIMNNEQLYNVLGYRLERGLNTFLGIRQYSDSGNLVEDNSLLERQYYRETAMSLFFDRPFLGWGANGFVTYMKKIGYSHVAYSHCNYTELLSTLGAIGFCLYYLIPVNILIRSLNCFRRNWNLAFLVAIELIVVILFTDYYMVSYISVFTQIIITMVYLVVENGWKESNK